MVKSSVKQFGSMLCLALNIRTANSDSDIARAVPRALIGGVYIHIFVFCPTNFF